MIRLVALLGSMATFGNAISVTGRAHQRANHTFFTAVPGLLQPVAPNAAPRQNLTLASAEIVCRSIDACIGFSFRSPTAMPSGVVDVSFKAVWEYCGYSRFPDGVCPEENGEDWQTYLKDYTPVARAPQWLRHYNLSVVPPRCGDINIEPLMPPDMSDTFVANYAYNAIEEYSSYVLEKGECGKVGPNGNPRALSYTKRSNPASLGTPWLGPGGGEGGGPGDPGYPGTAGGSLQLLCLEECLCSTSGKPIDSQNCMRNGPCPVCTDTNCVGRCVVCSPSFNNKLASNKTLVRLWCDPADPACKNNEPTRAPKNVRVLADFVPGSPTNVKWTEHNSYPPTSNLTIINPPIPAYGSRVDFATTAGASGCYVCALYNDPNLKDVPGQTTFVGFSEAGSSNSSQKWIAYENKGYSCTAKEFKKEIDTRQWNQTAAGCLGAAIKEGEGGDSYAEFSGTVYPNTGRTWIATIAPAFPKMDLSEYAENGAIVIETRYPRAHHCYADPGGGGSECHYEGFKLALTSFNAPRHHGGRELLGMYKADLGKAKSTTQGIDWTILRLPLTAFSSDWSDLTGECDTKDPDGYQHKCCNASSGTLRAEPCPTTKGLASIVGLSIWSEGVLGDFALELKSISIEI